MSETPHRRGIWSKIWWTWAEMFVGAGWAPRALPTAPLFLWDSQGMSDSLFGLADFKAR